MEKRKEKPKKLRKLSGLHTLSIILILAFVFYSFFEFSYENAEQAMTSNRAHLEELADQTSHSLQAKMEDALSLLKAVGVSLSGFEDLHSPEALAMLGEITEKSQFQRMRLTTLDGESRLPNGEMIQVAGRNYFKMAMNGSSGISQVLPSLYNQESILVFYTPLYRDGKIVGMLHAVQEVRSLADAVMSGHFGGEGYVHIFEKEGSLVLSTSKLAQKPNGASNLWEFYRKLVFEKGYSFQNFYEEVQNGKSGFTEYFLEGKMRIGYYRPLGVKDWYLIQIMPESVIMAQVEPVNQIVFTLIAQLLLFFAFLILGIIIFRNKAWRDLNLSNERFKIAISHTTNKIFEFDPNTQRIEFFTEAKKLHGLPQHIEDAGEYLRTGAISQKKFAPELLCVFQKITEGEKEAACVIQTEEKEGGKWERITLTNVLDKNGRPIRAIGTVEDITDAKKAEIRFAKEQKYRAAMFSDALSIFEINVTKDEFVEANELEESGLEREAQQEEKSYSLAHQDIAKSVVFPEDMEAFRQASDRDYLLRSFQNGKEELRLDYRRITPEGHVYWVCSTTNLLKDPTSGDIKAYVYVKDINEQKQRELELRYKAEHNSLTGLYNRATTERLITEFLKTNGMRGIHGFFILDLDDFKSVNDSFGHMVGDELLVKVAEQLSRIFRTSDIISRMGGDEFTVFLKDVGSVERIELKAAELCEQVHQLRLESCPEVRTSASVGISIAPTQASSFKDLYYQSDKALYEVKRKKKGSYQLYQED